MYRLFDGVVACDFPLHGIPETQVSEAGIHVLMEDGSVAEAGYDLIHSWHESDSGLVLSCARRNGEGGSPEYLLRFPGLADFVISGNTITCHPHPDCRDDSLQHLVLDQVIPRVWAHSGHLVLHASAVQLPDGRVIAFTGESGWGKSTLAAGLQADGSRLLSDDSISLRAIDGRVQLTPSYAGLRLNEDSIATLGIAARDWATVSHYSDKQRLAPGGSEGQVPLWLDTLYVMGEPGSAQAPSITLLAGAELIATLIKRSFLLDIQDTGCAAQQLGEIAAVLRSTPRVCSLDYPRDYRELPALCDALSGKAIR